MERKFCQLTATKQTLSLSYIRGVPITVALAKNSYASSHTEYYLPKHPNIKVVAIDTIAGKRIGHIANEHVGSVVVTSLLGINRAARQIS
jgi:hypothetical protein